MMWSTLEIVCRGSSDNICGKAVLSILLLHKRGVHWGNLKFARLVTASVIGCFKGVVSLPGNAFIVCCVLYLDEDLTVRATMSWVVGRLGACRALELWTFPSLCGAGVCWSNRPFQSQGTESSRDQTEDDRGTHGK